VLTVSLLPGLEKLGTIGDSVSTAESAHLPLRSAKRGHCRNSVSGSLGRVTLDDYSLL
jgi:hypothetical protein